MNRILTAVLSRLVIAAAWKDDTSQGLNMYGHTNFSKALNTALKPLNVSVSTMKRSEIYLDGKKGATIRSALNDKSVLKVLKAFNLSIDGIEADSDSDSPNTEGILSVRRTNENKPVPVTM